jgi:hypothetical protein
MNSQLLSGSKDKVIHPYLKRIILVACGVAVSALITALVEAWTSKMELATPGSYVLDYVFGPPWQHRNLGHVILVWFGTDFILVFSVLAVLYLLFTRLFVGRK